MRETRTRSRAAPPRELNEAAAWNVSNLLTSRTEKRRPERAAEWMSACPRGRLPEVLPKVLLVGNIPPKVWVTEERVPRQPRPRSLGPTGRSRWCPSARPAQAGIAQQLSQERVHTSTSK